MTQFARGLAGIPRLLACTLALLTGSPCAAQTLAALFDLARSGEPEFLGAVQVRAAAWARTEQALGAFQPQVSLTANSNINNRDYATRDAAISPMKDRYNANSQQLSITQPLWRDANVAGLRQAEAVALQAQYRLAGAEQELLVKLAAAWFDVLAARDAVLVSAQQTAATRRQWEVAQRGMGLGMASPPQAEEAKAKYDQALAESVAAETDSRIRRAALEQLVGALPDLSAPVLRDDAVLADASVDTLAKWLEALETGNPALLAAQQAFEAAGHEVSKQRAGHQPTLDLVTTFGKNSQGVGGFPGQAGYDIKQSAVSVQLNVPLYSGGTQSAKVDEAAAMKEKARLDIEAARRAAQFAAKQGWFGWQSAAARAQAGLQGVRATLAALQVARRGLENGLKTEFDVLQAEQQLAAARRDLRKARYDQLASLLKLKAAAGWLTVEDADRIDRLFVAVDVRPSVPPPPPPAMPERRPEAARSGASI